MHSAVESKAIKVLQQGSATSLELHRRLLEVPEYARRAEAGRENWAARARTLADEFLSIERSSENLNRTLEVALLALGRLQHSKPLPPNVADISARAKKASLRQLKDSNPRAERKPAAQVLLHPSQERRRLMTVGIGSGLQEFLAERLES